MTLLACSRGVLLAVTVLAVFCCVTVTVTAAAGTAQVRQKRGDDVPAIETTVGQLASQLASLTAELTAVKNQMTQLQNQVGTVAFYAWSTSAPLTVAARGIITMSHVETNVGNALDTLSSIFTAPVSGLYLFQAHILAYDMAEPRIHAEIMVGGRTVARCLSDSSHGKYDGTAMHALVHVNADQHVFMRNSDSTTTNYYGNPYVNFSGVLIRAD